MTAEEVDILLREGKTGPVMAKTRICGPILACARWLPAMTMSGRNVSRGIVLLDHAERDGLDGLSPSPAVGKLMTYRLMAEWVPTRYAANWATHAPWQPTADLALLVHKNPLKLPCVKSSPACLPRWSAVYRHGDRTPAG